MGWLDAENLAILKRPGHAGATLIEQRHRLRRMMSNESDCNSANAHSSLAASAAMSDGVAL